MVSKVIRARVKKVGLPAGSLVPENGKLSEKIHITIIDYSPQRFIEKKDVSLQECLHFLKTPSNTWINICGIGDTQTVEAIGRHFGLHPLMMEDIMSAGQRSKLDDYKDTIYIVARMLTYNEPKQCVDDEQVSFILGKNFVITFMESQNDVFAPIRDRLRHEKSRLRQRGSDYLCYALIDCLVDNYFLILEKVDQKLDKLENEIFYHGSSETVRKIHHAKHETTLLRKTVWPMREVISSFRRLDSPLIQDATKLYIQDVYDHTIQAIDTIESFRDIVSGMFDIYLSNLNQRMNEIMKVLTVMATIFVPLTFIASLYGMNFDYQPELHWKWGYPAVLIIMLIIAILMIVYFKRKKWI